MTRVWGCRVQDDGGLRGYAAMYSLARTSMGLKIRPWLAALADPYMVSELTSQIWGYLKASQRPGVQRSLASGEKYGQYGNKYIK